MKKLGTIFLTGAIETLRLFIVPIDVPLFAVGMSIIMAIQGDFVLLRESCGSSLSLGWS